MGHQRVVRAKAEGHGAVHGRTVCRGQGKGDIAHRLKGVLRGDADGRSPGRAGVAKVLPGLIALMDGAGDADRRAALGKMHGDALLADGDVVGKIVFPILALIPVGGIVAAAFHRHGGYPRLKAFPGGGSVRHGKGQTQRDRTVAIAVQPRRIVDAQDDVVSANAVKMPPHRRIGILKGAQLAQGYRRQMRRQRAKIVKGKLAVGVGNDDIVRFRAVRADLQRAIQGEAVRFRGLAGRRQRHGSGIGHGVNDDGHVANGMEGFGVAARALDNAELVMQGKIRVGIRGRIGNKPGRQLAVFDGAGGQGHKGGRAADGIDLCPVEVDVAKTGGIAQGNPLAEAFAVPHADFQRDGRGGSGKALKRPCVLTSGHARTGGIGVGVARPARFRAALVGPARGNRHCCLKALDVDPDLFNIRHGKVVARVDFLLKRRDRGRFLRADLGVKAVDAAFRSAGHADGKAHVHLAAVRRQIVVTDVDSDIFLRAGRAWRGLLIGGVKPDRFRHAGRGQAEHAARVPGESIKIDVPVSQRTVRRDEQKMLFRSVQIVVKSDAAQRKRDNVALRREFAADGLHGLAVFVADFRGGKRTVVFRAEHGFRQGPALIFRLVRHGIHSDMSHRRPGGGCAQRVRCHDRCAEKNILIRIGRVRPEHQPKLGKIHGLPCGCRAVYANDKRPGKYDDIVDITGVVLQRHTVGEFGAVLNVVAACNGGEASRIHVQISSGQRDGRKIAVIGGWYHTGYERGGRKGNGNGCAKGRGRRLPGSRRVGAVGMLGIVIVFREPLAKRVGIGKHLRRQYGATIVGRLRGRLGKLHKGSVHGGGVCAGQHVSKWARCLRHTGLLSRNGILAFERCFFLPPTGPFQEKQGGRRRCLHSFHGSEKKNIFQQLS